MFGPMRGGKRDSGEAEGVAGLFGSGGPSYREKKEARDGGSSASTTGAAEDPSSATAKDGEAVEEVPAKTYFSMAKLISRRFASRNKRERGGAVLFAKGGPPAHGGGSSGNKAVALASRRGTGPSATFVNNLELLWKPSSQASGPLDGVASGMGWYEGWGWDEMKGNWKTFSSRQRRKFEKALSRNSSYEDFALRDLLNRSSVSLPIRKCKRSMSETELSLRDQLSTEAAAMKIQKYVNYRIGKNLLASQDAPLSAGAASADGQAGGGGKRATLHFAREDFEPFAKASATLRASLTDFSNSFQEIASKATKIEAAMEKSLQSYVGSPRVSRGDNSSSSGAGGKSDLVIPWGILPGVLRAWEKTVDEWALQISQKQMQLEAAESERKRAKLGGGISLKDNDNFINIFTTASLPWMTGTAVNPLLRAAYLSRLDKKVTLVVPWLSPSDQGDVYPHNIVFDNPEQQEAYVMDWIKKRVPFEPNFKIKFYPAIYAKEKGSLLPVGDITRCVPDGEADIAILEEPEHLNWFHPGRRWNNKFQYVVGIVHTNYLDYVSREEGGNIKKNMVRSINSLVCRAYCDKVIKLSGAVQHLPKSEICNVHGVSPKFLEAPAKKALASQAASLSQAAAAKKQPKGSGSGFSKGVYFMGKALWAKGYSELLDLLAVHKKSRGKNILLDVFGSGPDFKEIVSRAEASGLSMNFLGAKDHQDASFRDYKVFVNPSLSDVVATTTAEALAMGKFVIVAEHPSNHFFAQFPNCMVYRTEEEFSKCVTKALQREPEPLSDEDRYRLTWEAATERLINVAEPGRKRNLTAQALDQLSWRTHHLLTNIEQFRKFAGAGVGTRHAPEDLRKMDGEQYSGAGFFDRARTKKARA